MISELVVDVQPKEISIAVLEDKNLVELQCEVRNVSFAVGDIFLGKVKKLMPGLNAAFIDVGYKKDAFLHYQDLGTNFNTQQKFLKQALTADAKRLTVNLAKTQFLPETEKDGSIGDMLSVGQSILVQIAKEPISTKGPRLTSELSFAGRYIVLMPFADKVSVSTKIKTVEERVRLRQLIQSIKPKNFSVIVRTSAEGKRVAELDYELKTLVKRWEDSMVKLPNVKVPAVLYEETGRTVALLRDIFNPSFQHIHVNDTEVYRDIHEYVHLISGREDIVRQYKGEAPIFDNFGITKQVKSLFGRTVTYKSGAYLIIEQTEAMHVIDVNSGNRSRGSNDQEETAIDVNLAAADEIARQLRLRDLGGIIVIDFIDMADPTNRQKLFDRITAAMSGDRAKHNILPLSKFGVMQITRQRVRPAMDVDTLESCPTCFGTGTAKQPSILFTDSLEGKIDCLVHKHKVKKFYLHLHPYVAAYINKGLFPLGLRWRLQYSFQLRVIPDQSLGLLEYRFYDPGKNELDMKEEQEIK